MGQSDVLEWLASHPGKWYRVAVIAKGINIRQSTVAKTMIALRALQEVEWNTVVRSGTYTIYEYRHKHD